MAVVRGGGRCCRCTLDSERCIKDIIYLLHGLLFPSAEQHGIAIFQRGASHKVHAPRSIFADTFHTHSHETCSLLETRVLTTVRNNSDGSPQLIVQVSARILGLINSQIRRQILKQIFDFVLLPVFEYKVIVSCRKMRISLGLSLCTADDKGLRPVPSLARAISKCAG